MQASNATEPDKKAYLQKIEAIFGSIDRLVASGIHGSHILILIGKSVCITKRLI